MTLWMVVAGLVSAVTVGCTKDTDCKGERICEAGQCVNPPAPAAAESPAAVSEPPSVPQPPPEAPNPADYPKVVRKNGVTCIQSLGDDGVVREDCRVEGKSYSGTRHPMDAAHASTQPSSSFPLRVEREAAPQRASVTVDFGVLGVMSIAAAGGSSGVLPGVGLHLSAQGRLGELVALGGAFNTMLHFGPGGFVGAFTLAPALRLGDQGHGTLSLGPSLLLASTYLGTAAGLAGSFIIHGVVPLSEGFGLHLQLGVTFGAGAALITLGSGFGGSVF